MTWPNLISVHDGSLHLKTKPKKLLVREESYIPVNSPSNIYTVPIKAQLCPYCSKEKHGVHHFQIIYMQKKFISQL